MKKNIKICFFSHEPIAQLYKEQYSVQDINILNEISSNVHIANTFGRVPWNCDLYFSWWASGSILPLIKARLCGKPIVVVAGGNDSMLHRDSSSGRPMGYLVTSWYKKLATRLTLTFSSRVLVVSEYMLEDVKRLGAENPVVVFNSVDVEKFKYSSSTRKYVTSIFRLDESVILNKRAENFIRSIPMVLNDFPEQKFIIIGEKCNAYNRLYDFVVHLGIEDNVDFLGSINNSEVVEWMQESKVYVQVSDTETFGVAVAEAMSCGTPVVISRRGALPEVAGAVGFYVDHDSPESIAQGIGDVLSMASDEASQVSAQSRNIICSKFSYEKRRDSIVQIINDLIC